jgi:hypothetical protein
MLSEPKHYSYQDTADKLGISLTQLAQYIKGLEVRAAVSTSNYQIKALLHQESLSEKNQQALMRGADQHALIKGWDPIPSAAGTPAVPDYLYVNPFNKVIRYTDEPPHEFKSLLLETFDGQPVIPLDSNGWIVHVYLGARDENGLYSKGVIPAEEIARLSPKVPNHHAERVAETLPEPKKRLGHFKVAKRNNLVREAICHYGTLYIQQRKENPTAELLLAFMLDKSKTDSIRHVTYDAKNQKPICIVGTRMNQISFRKRFIGLFIE